MRSPALAAAFGLPAEASPAAAAGNLRTHVAHCHPRSVAGRRSRRRRPPPSTARALQVLVDAGVPFLVGGAFSHACFTGIRRSTKDLDLFIRREDYDRVARADAGRRAGAPSCTYPHWLAKVYAGRRTSST